MATVRTRKRGKTYSYIFEAGKTPDGKRKVVEKGGFATKEEAYNAGADAFTSFKHGNLGIISEKISVADYIDLYYKSHSTKVRVSTTRIYKVYIKHIKEHLGNIILQELKPRNVDAMIQKMYLAGLSYAFINATKSFLYTALDYAVYPAELLSSNPVVNIKVPKSAPKNVVQRSIVLHDDFTKLLEAAKNRKHDYVTPIMICYHTGMRKGEVLGLLWDDIDFEAGTITVRHQRDSTEYSRMLQPLKTESSYRTIYASKDLLQYLEEKKKHITALYRTFVDDEGICMQTTSDTAPEGHTEIFPVCCDDNGCLFAPSGFSKFLGKQGLNAHSFRHTHATFMAEANSNPKNIAARLGHKTTSITQDLYTHITDVIQKEAMISFENKLQDMQTK